MLPAAALSQALLQCCRAAAARTPMGWAALGVSTARSLTSVAGPTSQSQQLLWAATLQQQQPLQQQQAWGLLHQRASCTTSSSSRAFSSSAAAGAADAGLEGPPSASSSSSSSSSMPGASGLQSSEEEEELDRLLQVLLHPMPRTAKWNGQLTPHLLGVNDQLLVQPSAVLLSLLRALHVIRGVLQEDGQVYVVESNRLLRPLVKTAAAACINPNMWFYHRTWSPGMLTNYASANRLFKESHQPNRRLFAAKGYRPTNPLCPRPPPASAPLPRLSWDDKWLLYRRTRQPGYRALLEELLVAEDALHRFKPAGSLRGTPRNLSLMVFLDSTKNAVAIREAYNRNIPTVAVANTLNDMSQVTYPVLARDFSPNFIHFFLDWIVKVANAAPQTQEQGGEGNS